MTRYIERVSGRVWFATTIASGAYAPTVAEIGAAVLLSDAASTNALADIEGFTASASFVDTPLFGASQTPKVPGEVQLADSALIFYRDSTTNPLLATLADGTVGFVIFAGPGANVTTSTKVDVFPVQVGGNNNVHSSANEAARFRVDFAINNIPAKNISVLA